MTQENLQAENAELKRKLAEAEKALAVAQRGLKCRQEAEAQAHRTYHDAMDKLPVEAKYLHDPAAQPADMMARMVARAESAERKCAELSEALRDKQDKRCDALAQLLDRNAKLLAALREAEALAVRRGGRWDLEDQVSHERIKAVIADAALASQPAPEAKPVPLVLYCPAGHLHVDEGEWATRPHKTHQCQRPKDCGCGMGSRCERLSLCGLEWRPADFPTVGVKPTPEAP